MKKHTWSVIALILALASLALSVFTFLSVRNLAEEYDTRLRWMEEKYQHLQSRLDEAAATVPGETLPSEAATTPEDYAYYCNLILGQWNFDGASLTVDSAFAQVMAAPGVTVTDAQKILYLNGEILYLTDLTLHPGEASDSYELDLAAADYQLPELSEGDHVELLLEVTLSDGTFLTAWGGTWDYEKGRLLMVAG